jgi:segregation and condensation protein A
MEFTTKQFSGPLDLLLSLISEEKMSITEIAISEVTEQYVRYVDGLEEDQISPEELADFLVVAAKLLLIKSRALLPLFAVEEEDGPSLADQLRLYKAFVDASKWINSMWLDPNQGFFRLEPLRKSEGFVPPANATVETLHGSMLQLLLRLAPPKPLPKTTLDKGVSLKDKITNLKLLIAKHKSILFHHTVENMQNKTEMIVSFLALLELVKQEEVQFQQETHFGDILVSKSVN